VTYTEGRLDNPIQRLLVWGEINMRCSVEDLHCFRGSLVFTRRWLCCSCGKFADADSLKPHDETVDLYPVFMQYSKLQVGCPRNFLNGWGPLFQHIYKVDLRELGDDEGTLRLDICQLAMRIHYGTDTW